MSDNYYKKVATTQEDFPALRFNHYPYVEKHDQDYLIALIILLVFTFFIFILIFYSCYMKYKTKKNNELISQSKLCQELYEPDESTIL